MVLLFMESWEVTEIKLVGTAWSVWQWQEQCWFVSRGVRATTGDVQSQFPPLWHPQVNWGYLWTVAGHAHLWNQR